MSCAVCDQAEMISMPWIRLLWHVRHSAARSWPGSLQVTCLVEGTPNELLSLRVCLQGAEPITFVIDITMDRRRAISRGSAYSSACGTILISSACFETRNIATRWRAVSRPSRALRSWPDMLERLRWVRHVSLACSWVSHSTLRRASLTSAQRSCETRLPRFETVSC